MSFILFKKIFSMSREQIGFHSNHGQKSIFIAFKWKKK